MIMKEECEKDPNPDCEFIDLLVSAAADASFDRKTL
jgi:hypothetical protein